MLENDISDIFGGFFINGEKPQNFSVGWLVKNHKILLDQQKQVVPGNNELLW